MIISSWSAVYILMLTLLIFWIVYKKRQYISYRVSDFFSRDELFTFSKPVEATDNFLVICAMLILTCASLGIIVSGMSNIYNKFDGEGSGAGMAVKVTGGSLIFFICKGCIYSIINWVFFSSERNRRWIKSYFFITGAFAFVLYPFALIELFAGFNFKLLSGILIFIFITYEISLFYKLSVNFRVRSYGILLIFLYLCALELLPALLVWQNVR